MGARCAEQADPGLGGQGLGHKGWGSHRQQRRQGPHCRWGAGPRARTGIWGPGLRLPGQASEEFGLPSDSDKQTHAERLRIRAAPPLNQTYPPRPAASLCSAFPPRHSPNAREGLAPPRPPVGIAQKALPLARGHAGGARTLIKEVPCHCRAPSVNSGDNSCKLSGPQRLPAEAVPTSSSRVTGVPSPFVLKSFSVTRDTL